MRTVAYTCHFVPAEWIAAHGLEPRKILPSRSMDPGFHGVSQGFCPYAQALISQAAELVEGNALVMTTACDQMRRASELVARKLDVPLFLMNVPTTWETAAAQKLYRSEIERLGRFLVRQGGRKPSEVELAEKMLAYDATREQVRAARGLLSPRAFAEAIALFHSRGTVPDLSKTPGTGSKGFPLALVGGPLLADHLELFDLLDQLGGRVVLDATGTGERILPAPLNRREVRRDPLGELTRAYFGSIPDAYLRPNTTLYRWLAEKLAERRVGGILFFRHTWCDTWHAEAQRMKEWCNLPFMVIDSGSEDHVNNRTRNRVQAFMEMLQ